MTPAIIEWQKRKDEHDGGIHAADLASRVLDITVCTHTDLLLSQDQDYRLARMVHILLSNHGLVLSRCSITLHEDHFQDMCRARQSSKLTSPTRMWDLLGQTASYLQPDWQHPLGSVRCYTRCQKFLWVHRQTCCGGP